MLLAKDSPAVRVITPFANNGALIITSPPLPPSDNSGKRVCGRPLSADAVSVRFPPTTICSFTMIFPKPLVPEKISLLLRVRLPELAVLAIIGVATVMFPSPFPTSPNPGKSAGAAGPARIITF